MTLSVNINDLEKEKFAEGTSGLTAVRVIVDALSSTPLPTGGSTEAKQDTGNTSLASIDTKLTSPLSAAQSGAWNITNVTGTVSLPTGAATSANQVTANSSLSSLDTKTPAVGQAVMASSRPVVIASNQSAISVAQSGTWNVTNISGTVSLPTGAATAANQSTANTSLANIDAGTPASLGQLAMSASTSVVVASDQTALPISGTVTATASKAAQTAAAPTFATVGVASAQAVVANASRTGLVLINDSTNKIYLGLGATAVIGRGILLAPYGSFTMDANMFTVGAVNAIASGASSNLCIQELTT